MKLAKQVPLSFLSLFWQSDASSLHMSSQGCPRVPTQMTTHSTPLGDRVSRATGQMESSEKLKSGGRKTPNNNSSIQISSWIDPTGSKFYFQSRHKLKSNIILFNIKELL